MLYNSCNLPYFVCFLGTGPPPPSQCGHHMCTCPLACSWRKVTISLIFEEENPLRGRIDRPRPGPKIVLSPVSIHSLIHAINMYPLNRECACLIISPMGMGPCNFNHYYTIICTFFGVQITLAYYTT